MAGQQGDVVFAILSVMTAHPDGTPVMVKEGDPWDASDPFVAARPELFGHPDPAKVKRSPGHEPAPAKTASKPNRGRGASW